MSCHHNVIQIKMVSFKLAFGLFVGFCAYMYSTINRHDNRWEDQHNSLVLKAWEANISPPSKRFSRVSIGTNACVDLIVKGVDLLNSLQVVPGAASDHNILNTVTQLQEVYSFFFRQGTAAERYFADEDVFRMITSAASKLDDLQWSVGGNAALMAQNMARLFADVKLQLVGPIGPRARSLLHPRILVPSMVPHDEVHLIMEHQVGETWGSYSTPVANRFITSNAEYNGKMKFLEKFFMTVDKFHPDLIVFSGLHMLEGQEESVYEERVRVLREGLDQVTPLLPVHLELASMANAGLLTTVVQEIFYRVSAIGLNEQELTFTSHVMSGPHKDLYATSTRPEIHHVVDMMAWMLQEFGYSTHNQESHLTRIHFHTLSFHIIAILPGSWKNIPSAVAAGTRNAGQQACDTFDLDPSNIELLIPQNFKLFKGDSERRFDPLNPVISFIYKGFEFSLSPVLVCKEPLKTVGLGDSISATGLLYSVFNPHFR